MDIPCLPLPDTGYWLMARWAGYDLDDVLLIEVVSGGDDPRPARYYFAPIEDEL